MADVTKAEVQTIDHVAQKSNVQRLDAAQRHNAVGYDEYLEAMGLEISDAEVCAIVTQIYERSSLHLFQTKRVRWKLDLIILPIFLVTQALQFIDKTSLNYANLFGYQKALGLKGKQFNYLSASEFFALQSRVCKVKPTKEYHERLANTLPVIYAGYFFGQYPCGWLIGRFPAQKVLAVSIMLWGITVLIMTQARSYRSACKLKHIWDRPSEGTLANLK